MGSMTCNKENTCFTRVAAYDAGRSKIRSKLVKFVHLKLLFYIYWEASRNLC